MRPSLSRIAGLTCLLSPLASADTHGPLCSDLSIAPPVEIDKVKDKVIFQEIVAGSFPGALFPLSFASTHEVSPDDRYYDDRGRVLSGRAALAVLENFPVSQDLILAWRNNKEAASQSRLDYAAGVAGIASADPGTIDRSISQVQDADANLERLSGGAESAFIQALCAFNAAQATRRARAAGGQ